jgi:ABC-type phosphate transport system substrate-binding protein
MRVREIALMLLAALLASLGLGCTNNGAESGLPPGTVQLTGAGATFPAPLYEKWLEVYQTVRKRCGGQRHGLRQRRSRS